MKEAKGLDCKFGFGWSNYYNYKEVENIEVSISNVLITKYDYFFNYNFLKVKLWFF